jgi:hypothetical protein
VGCWVMVLSCLGICLELFDSCLLFGLRCLVLVVVSGRGSTSQRARPVFGGVFREGWCDPSSALIETLSVLAHRL